MRMIASEPTGVLAVGDVTSDPIARRVLAAARECFETYGISKTTIVDIAKAAGLSRPLVYRHFGDKQEIVDWVCIGEMEKVRTRIRARLEGVTDVPARMTEAMLGSIVVASRNIYIRRFLEDHPAWARSQRRQSLIHDWTMQRWGSFITDAQSSGVLAKDLVLEETVEWMAMAQSMLLLRFDNAEIDEDEMRRFIRRFVVAPLLA